MEKQLCLFFSLLLFLFFEYNKRYGKIGKLEKLFPR